MRVSAYPARRRLHLAFAPEAILQQLERVLHSRRFRASKQLRRFLSYVVEENLAGRTHGVKQYTIAVNAFGRERGFDPVNDPIVRIEARRLRRLLALYYRHEGFGDPILIEIPKGSYAPAFRSNMPRTTAESGAVATVAKEGTRGPTILLIVFASPGRARRLDRLAAELTEETACALARFEFVRLVGPAPAEGAEKLELRRLARHYGADLVLSATLHGRRNGTRILPRLLDAETREIIWSSEARLTPNDETARDRVVRSLARAIGDLNGVALNHLVNRLSNRRAKMPEQHEALVRYRDGLRSCDGLAMGEAVRACERAVKRWPDDALANALLSHLCLVDHRCELGLSPNPLERSLMTARRALRLDPVMQFSQFQLGEVLYTRETAENRAGEATTMLSCWAEFEEALGLNPTSETAAWIGLRFCLLGDWDRGAQVLQDYASLGTKPAPVVRIASALTHYREGDFEAAWGEAGRIDVPMMDYWGPLIRAATLGQLGRREQAQGELDELLRTFPEFPSRGPEKMKAELRLDEHVAPLLDGLRKAGLEQRLVR